MLREIVTYLVALPASIGVAAFIFHLCARLHRNAIGRFIARLMAACTGCLVFVSIFHIAGTNNVLNPDGAFSSWTDDATIALVLGFLYALVWPFVPLFRRYD